MNTINQYKPIKTKSTISETTNTESERTISQSRSQNSTKEQKEIVGKKLKSRKSKKHLGCRLNKSQFIMIFNQKTTEEQKTPEEITNFFDSEFAKNYKGRENGKKNPFANEGQDDFNKILYTIKNCVENCNAIEEIKKNFCTFDVICLAAGGYTEITEHLKDYYEEPHVIERLKELASGFESQALRTSFKKTIKLIQSM